LGLIGIAEAIPFFAIALFAGHLADIFDRRKIIIIADFIFLICSFTLFIFNYKFAYIFHEYKALPIYLVFMLVGLARGTIYPAQTGLMAKLVPRELYANSSTWNSTVWHIAAVSGPALGGLIYGFYGKEAAFLTVTIFVAISFILYFWIKSQPLPANKTQEPIFKSLRTGIKFVLKTQILLGAMTLDMFAVLFGAQLQCCCICFCDTKDRTGRIGLLRAAPAAGAVIMAFILAYNPPLKYADATSYCSYRLWTLHNTFRNINKLLPVACIINAQRHE